MDLQEHELFQKVSTVEDFLKMKKDMKNSDDIVLHNTARMVKIANEKKKSKKKIQEERLSRIKEFIKICNDYIFDENGIAHTENYKTGTKCGNIVGDRIRFILEEYNMTIVELGKKAGVGKSSLARYLSPINPSVPTVTTLDKILNALPCDYEDFLFSPHDYKEWENGFRNGYRVRLYERYFYYDAIRDQMKSDFYDTIVYGKRDNIYRMPPEIADLFIKQMMIVFDTIDALLEYEKNKKAKPKVFYDLPLIQEIEF